LLRRAVGGGRAAWAPRGGGALVDGPVRYRDGGNAACHPAGHPFLSADPRMGDEPVDVWLKPYERASGTTAAMNEYLSWEVDLLARIGRDGTTQFLQF